MGKLDELLRTAGGNAAESMGTRTMHRASQTPAVSATPERLRGVSRAKAAAEIPVDRIAADPDQPREEFAEEGLRRLAESMKARGQLQPIRVRWNEEQGRYVVLIGERRWRAAQMAGLATLSCIIVDEPMDPAEVLAVQLVENALREDLRPIEQAKAYRRLMDRHGWSTHRLAAELGVDQSGVVRALSLLELPVEVQDQVEQGTLAPATAYELSKIGDAEAQAMVAAQVVEGRLTRAEAARLARRAGAGRGKPRRPRKVTTRTIRTSTGAKVTVDCRRGLDGASIIAALEEAAAVVRREVEGADCADAA